MNKHKFKVLLFILSITIVIISVSGCESINLFNQLYSMANKDNSISGVNDEKLVNDLKGAIIYESTRKNTTPQLFRVSLPNLKISKFSNNNMYWEGSPEAVKDKIYFNLNLTTDQRGANFDNRIEGIYSQNLDGTGRRKILYLKNGVISYYIIKNMIFYDTGNEKNDFFDIGYFYKNKNYNILSSNKSNDVFFEASLNESELLYHSTKYVKNEDQQTFYIYNIKTKKKRLLLKQEWMAKDVSFSKDGKKAVFISALNRKQSIYTINIDGTGLNRITNDNYVNQNPQFSPDGKYIVYASVRDGDNPFQYQTIHVITTDGKRHAQITQWTGKSSDINPTWTYSK